MEKILLNFRTVLCFWLALTLSYFFEKVYLSDLFLLKPTESNKPKYLIWFQNMGKLLKVSSCTGSIVATYTVPFLFKFVFVQEKEKRETPRALLLCEFSSLQVSEKLPETLICFVIFNLFERTLTFCLPSFQLL